MSSPRVVQATNSGPFTLEGTRAHLVGHRSVAVIDPGPDDEAHLASIVAAVSDAVDVTILVTHDHADHSAAAPALAARLQAPILGSTRHAHDRLREGETVDTDDGTLRALAIPGHTADHIAFAWSRGKAVFVGDHLLGEGETTWVGEYEGCVRDYLESLDRIEAVGAAILYPAHGPPLSDPAGAIRSYREHRLSRIEQVRRRRSSLPGATPADLVTAIYGTELPPGLRAGAEASVVAMLGYLDAG